jgi:hypothetical protein
MKHVKEYLRSQGRTAYWGKCKCIRPEKGVYHSVTPRRLLPQLQVLPHGTVNSEMLSLLLASLTNNLTSSSCTTVTAALKKKKKLCKSEEEIMQKS